MARPAILLVFLVSLAHAQSPLEQAVTLAREKRYAEAAELLRSAAEPTPTPQKIAFHRLKAAVASGLNDAIGAAQEMRQALAFAPSDAALLLATAVAEMTAGQLTAAIDHSAAAVRTDPSKEEYRSTLAFALILHQDFAAAIDALQPAKSARLRTLLGIAQFALGDVEDAAATLSQAIAIDPAAEPAYRSLAQIVLQSSSAPGAVIVNQLCGWNATVCSALKLRTARETGDNKMLAEAITGLERAPQADVIAHCELARAREWTDLLPEARTEMEKCTSADPSPQNHYRLGLIYRRLGLTDLAKQQMDLRQQQLTQMSEQTANGLSVLKTFR